MPDRIVVRSIWSQDRRHRLDIFKRSDGRYGFVGNSRQTESQNTFWTSTEFSGTYESARDAERDAAATVPWLKGQFSN
jgi:hypothetical protein